MYAAGTTPHVALEIPSVVPSQSLENMSSNSLLSEKLLDVWKVMVALGFAVRSMLGVISHAMELASPDW